MNLWIFLALCGLYSLFAFKMGQLSEQQRMRQGQRRPLSFWIRIMLQLRREIRDLDERCHDYLAEAKKLAYENHNHIRDNEVLDSALKEQSSCIKRQETMILGLRITLKALENSRNELVTELEGHRSKYSNLPAEAVSIETRLVTHDSPPVSHATYLKEDEFLVDTGELIDTALRHHATVLKRWVEVESNRDRTIMVAPPPTSE